eukprot:Colp12_sorted_trinity150504_noHs@31230
MLSKAFRNTQKLIEKDIHSVAMQVDSIPMSTPEEAAESLSSLVMRLTSLKRKLEDGLREEELHIKRCNTRLNHLQEYQHVTNKEGEDVNERWKAKRLDRILVDHMLRDGNYDSATLLAKDSGIEDLVDVDLFIASRKIEDALKSRNRAEALAWCAENRSRLRKLKSNLEFKLRVQEFIELIRQGKRIDAIKYSRKYLAPWAETNMKEVQQAMAALAFQANTDCPTYYVSRLFVHSFCPPALMSKTPSTTNFPIFYLPQHCVHS